MAVLACEACLGREDCRYSQIEIWVQDCVLLARQFIARLQDQQIMLQIAVQSLAEPSRKAESTTLVDQIQNSSSSRLTSSDQSSDLQHAIRAAPYRNDCMLQSK